jgi:hypothetical protein
MRRTYLFLPALAVCAIATPAAASEDDGELWLNPSVSTGISDRTSVELETAQRFRDAGEGRDDTYFFRLWLNHDVSDALTVSGAVERRINDGGRNETRTMQQLTGRWGIMRTRARMEQRMVDDSGRTGWRLRTRVGVETPINDSAQWKVFADAEPFWTLRATSAGGDTGLTGLRTQIGVGYEVNDNLALSVGYLRQQDIASGAPDTVGHAPIIGVEFAF